MVAANLRTLNGLCYFGCGIYDVGEVARLLRCEPLVIKAWTRLSVDGPVLLTAELGGQLFSFRDLVSVRVIAELVKQHVPRQIITNSAAYLANELQTDRPFAHQHLATASSGFFAKNRKAWTDAGLNSQQAFKNIIEPLMRDIDYNEHHMAVRWWPAVGISIDPTVQAGCPCVAGTRVPTSVIAAAVVDGTGDTASRRAQVCDDYRLTDTQVRHAVNYEQSLDRWTD